MKTSIAELSVLVTDDSLVQREYAEAICREIGAQQIYNAVDGVQALKVLQEKNIDIVLVDLEMPIMDGVDLLRNIAQQGTKKSVIILSAKDPILISSVGTMAEADGLHVLGTFQKPLKADMLLMSLTSHLQDLQNASKESASPREDLVTALELNEGILNNEFCLAYQPKLTVDGLILRGVEALARWKHPTKGTVSPGTFIPLAERHGLIDALTRNLMLQAFQQKQQWQQFGLRFGLAFNLSPLSLADLDLVDNLSKMAESFQLSPNEITFEVTENALLSELACAIRTLARLRLKGFNVSIDDYGTGFANAQQLSRVPATELKIDRSLVHRSSTRPQQHTIMASTVELAKKLSLTTVAEGVETLDDFKVLVALGVDQVQGFYFSKPLYPNDLLSWIKTDLSDLRRRHYAKN